MPLTRIAPTRVLETRALMAAGGLKRPPPWLSALAVRQALDSASFGLVDERGHLVVSLMFWPIAPGLEELAFVVDPPARPSLYLPSGLALTRLSLADRFDTGITAIRALVSTGHQPGHRLARLAGFSPAGEADGFTVYEVRA